MVPFRLRQLGRILQIERACFPEEPYSEELFRHYHRQCADLFLVAKSRIRIRGYSITCVRGSRAEVISIAVDPVARRAGVATRLLDHTLRSLRRADLGTVGLMVRQSAGGAIAFYRCFGFRRVKKVPAYYSDGEDALRMTRTP